MEIKLDHKNPGQVFAALGLLYLAPGIQGSFAEDGFLIEGGERGMDEEALAQIRRRVRARGLEALVAALG